MEKDIFETFKTFLPAYLSPEQKDELFSELRSFPDNVDYYLKDKYTDELLQGDGWDEFRFIELTNKEERSVKGIVLSNSCDITLENKGAHSRKIVFSPLYSLSAYEKILLQYRNQNEVDNVLRAIKNQEITYIFYLPKFDKIPESIIILDDLHSLPLSEFPPKEKTKLFTLSQYGFYIFIMKLSIHFTRFQENVSRFSV